MEHDERDRERDQRNCESDHALFMKKLELEKKQHELSPTTSPLISLQPHFDVCKNIRLVPSFLKKDVDKYFRHFERVAVTLNWPKDAWPLQLQCVLRRKAQEVFSALAID